MELYLIQHAQSNPKEEDPQRGLSPEGRRTIETVTGHLVRQGLRVGVIYHSTKLRARQTAEAYSKVIRSWRGVVERQGLAPMDDIAPLVEELANSTKDLVIIGHLPFLSRLAGALLAGDPEREVISFQQGGVVALARDDAKEWHLSWTLFPSVLGEGGPPGPSEDVRAHKPFS